MLDLESVQFLYQIEMHQMKKYQDQYANLMDNDHYPDELIGFDKGTALNVISKSIDYCYIRKNAFLEVLAQ